MLITDLKKKKTLGINVRLPENTAPLWRRSEGGKEGGTEGKREERREGGKDAGREEGRRHG